MPEFYIVLQRKLPDVPNDVPGLAIAKAESFLGRLARKLGVVELTEFKSQSPAVTDALAGLNGLDLSDIQLGKETWFAPLQGLQTVATLKEHLQSHPAALPNTNEVLGELKLWNEVLARATKEGVPWHLLIAI